jgi:hypothetical protein
MSQRLPTRLDIRRWRVGLRVGKCCQIVRTLARLFRFRSNAFKDLMYGPRAGGLGVVGSNPAAPTNSVKRLRQVADGENCSSYKLAAAKGLVALPGQFAITFHPTRPITAYERH